MVVPLRPERVRPPRGAALGRIAGTSSDGRVLVETASGTEPVLARVIAGLDQELLKAAASRGDEVVVLFTPEPVVLDVLRPSAPVPVSPPAEDFPESIRVDGKRLSFEGTDEVVISCGEASITLRRNGRVTIRGTLVESHSKGVQRVSGATVKIN